MPQRQVDIAIVHQEVVVNDGSWRPLQHPLARVSGGRDIDKEGGTNTTLDRGGDRIGAKMGPHRLRTTNMTPTIWHRRHGRSARGGGEAAESDHGNGNKMEPQQ